MLLENDYLAVRNHWISGTLKRVNTYVDSDGVLSHISKESIIELTIFAMVGQLTGPVRIYGINAYVIFLTFILPCAFSWLGLQGRQVNKFNCFRDNSSDAS